MARSGIPLVCALVGGDNFLQLQEWQRLAASVGADAQRAEFDGETAELAEVLDELRSYSMFGGSGPKLVLVRSADAFVTRFRESLESYVSQPSDTGVLVMRMSSLPKTQRIYKLIDKLGGIVNCDAPKDPTRWAVEHARSAHHVTLAPDAARLLSDLIGSDMGRLDTEIGKLAINADETGGKISADLVLANVAFTRDRDMWDMTNALAVGNTAEALRRWRQLVELKPSAEFIAIGTLAKWIEDVGVVVSRGAGAGKQLYWKYKEALPKFIAGAQAMGRQGHARALDLLTELDRQSKSGVGDAAGNVERFILAMAVSRDAAGAQIR